MMTKEEMLAGAGMAATTPDSAPESGQVKEVPRPLPVAETGNSEVKMNTATPAEAPVESLSEAENAPVQEIEKKPEPKVDPRLGKERATPAARRLAREHGIALMTVPGTGPQGRIQLEDVRRMVIIRPGPSDYCSKEPAVIGTIMDIIEGNPENVRTSGKEATAVPKTTKPPQPAKPEEPTPVKAEPRKRPFKKNRNHKSEIIPNPELDFVPFVEGEAEPLREEIIVKAVPMSELDKTAAEKNRPDALPNNADLPETDRERAEQLVTVSLETAVINLTTEIDMTEVKELRKKLAKKIESQAHFRCTYTDFLLMATARALIKHPAINSCYEEQQIIPHDQVHLGLAVEGAAGMIVPVIRNAQDLSFIEMVRSRGETLKSVKNDYLTREDLTGSTFTIMNLGMLGILEFTAIINHPNSAILSVGEVVSRVRVHQGEAVVRSVMKVTLNLDHRVADGIAGARFLKDIKEDMENPSLLLF